MKLGQYVFLLMLGMTCAGLSIAVVAIASSAGRVQSELQQRQLRINSGLAGQQGQQISAGILQDLANLSQRDSKVMSLLKRYGYTVNAPEGADGGQNSVQPRTEEE
jgi:hypothetical protein